MLSLINCLKMLPITKMGAIVKIAAGIKASVKSTVGRKYIIRYVTPINSPTTIVKKILNKISKAIR